MIMMSIHHNATSTAHFEFYFNWTDNNIHYDFIMILYYDDNNTAVVGQTGSFRWSWRWCSATTNSSMKTLCTPSSGV